MLSSQGRDKYFKVAQIANNFLAPFSSSSVIDVQSLFKNITDSNLDVNYDEISESFTKKYWIRNYWKAVYFFEYKLQSISIDLNRESNLQVLVLGSGSGADTVACLVWLNKFFTSKGRVAFTLVDKSQKQLDLASKLIEKVRHEINNVEFDIKYENVDVNNWNPIPDSADLVLMSHFLTENKEELDILLEKVKLSVKAKARVVTIERERDSVWQKTSDTLMNMGIPVLDMKTYKKDLTSLFASVEDEKSQLLTITPHYVLAKLPEDMYQLDIIAKYFYAWKNQSTEPILEIFSKDAKYYEKPLIDPPIKGLNGIKEYWYKNPISQRNIQVRTKRIGYEAGYVICEWGGDFDTPKQHISIQGAMILDIDPRTRQIKELREYFNTIKTPFN